MDQNQVKSVVSIKSETSAIGIVLGASATFNPNENGTATAEQTINHPSRFCGPPALMPPDCEALCGAHEPTTNPTPTSLVSSSHEDSLEAAALLEEKESRLGSEPCSGEGLELIVPTQELDPLAPRSKFWKTHPIVLLTNN